jgi:hypothetical protein
MAESSQTRFTNDLTLGHAVIALGGLSGQKCRDMQAVVMRAFMEKRHDAQAAREILEALGLARVFKKEEDSERDTSSVSLTMGRGLGGTFK